MTNDSIFAPGFFDLRDNSGLGALDGRQLADIGAAQREDGQFEVHGRVVEEPKSTGAFEWLVAALARQFAAGTPRHA